MKFTAFLTMMLTLLISACNSGGIPPDTVVIGIESEPTSLDPRLATDANSSRINGLIYSGLLRQDEKGLIQPDLALNWETPDPRTYLFHLREGIRFHDGTALTSSDVKYTFDSILDPAVGSPHKSTYEQIERIETQDEKTIRFVLKEPFAPFLLSMAMGIVPAQNASAKGVDFAKAPVGTGPFRLAKRDQGESYDLSANPDYFEGAPKLSRVIFRVVPDNTVRFLELQKGTLNLVINGIELDYIPLIQKDPRLKLMTGPGLNYSYIGFNLTDPILIKQKVREAVAYAVDRKAIIRYLLKGMARPATGLLSPLNWAYSGGVKEYEYNPGISRTLLDQAGFPDPDGDGTGMRFTLSYKTSQDEQGKRIAAALQQQFKQVGIGLTIRSYEWGTFYGDIKSGNFQLYSLSWVGVTDPDIYDYIFHSKNFPPAGANRGRYANPEVNALLEHARRTLDLTRRKEYYRRVQEILARDLPYVSLWHYDNVAVMRKNVEGFVLDPRGDLYSLKDVWVDKN